jgi:hypothetical protein
MLTIDQNIEANEALEILNPCCKLTTEAEVNRIRVELETEDRLTEDQKVEFVERYEQQLRVLDSLESAGVEVKIEKHLDRMTNVQTVWGGHLKDATLHYVWRVVVSGNTFPIKDVIKSLGFKWERYEKQWVRNCKKGPGIESGEVRKAIAAAI